MEIKNEDEKINLVRHLFTRLFKEKLKTENGFALT